MFEGTARDRILKGLLLQKQSAGAMKNLSATPQGARGIDIFYKSRSVGYDLTTQKSWPAHVSKYKDEFDIVLPLLYR